MVVLSLAVEILSQPDNYRASMIHQLSKAPGREASLNTERFIDQPPFI